MRLLVSWLMIGVGCYVYVVAGLGYSFLPFLIAAVLRGSRDKQVADMLFRQSPWKLVAVGYYICLLVAVLIDPRRFTNASGITLALVMTLPLAAMAIWNDIVECMSHGNLTGERRNARDVLPPMKNKENG